MTIHLLIHTISVERATTVIDNGVPQTQWATHLAAIKARVQPLVAREHRRRLRIYVECAHDIRTTDRITYGGDTFNIEDVRDDGAFQVIDAQEANP